MGYEIIRGPFMLYETIGMLFRYVNRISFQSVLSRQRLLQGAPATKALTRRLTRLQEIMEEVCQGLDPDDPVLRRYFGRVDMENREFCLLQVLTEPFGRPNRPGLVESVTEICEAWKEWRSGGIRIQRDTGDNIIAFADAPGCTEDLFTQILELDIPAELRLHLYDTFRNFDDRMAMLTKLMLPLSDRLEEIFRQNVWLLDETEEYWRKTFEKMSPAEYLMTHSSGDVVRLAKKDTQVAIALMNCNNLDCWLMREDMDNQIPNFIYIGCGITANSLPRKRGDDLENVGTILRTIGDKKKLEILRRLSKERLYLHELADLMGIDPGSMSRALTTLHNYGFLQQEREALRNYYQTDRAAVHNFLELVETIIFS